MGQFKNDKYRGKAVFTTEKCTIKAEFLDGNYSGYGLSFDKNLIYYGEFKDNKQHGQGMFKNLKDGSIFKGKFLNGEIASGKRYYKNGKVEEVEYTFYGGDVYKGDFKDGFPTGKAEITYKDGAKYVGEVQKLLHHGKGNYTLSNGTIYEGEFKNGAPNGIGKLITDGKIKKGYFVNGSYVGQSKPTEN